VVIQYIVTAAVLVGPVLLAVVVLNQMFKD